jgi:hypothetical protein
MLRPRPYCRVWPGKLVARSSTTSECVKVTGNNFVMSMLSTTTVDNLDSGWGANHAHGFAIALTSPRRATLIATSRPGPLATIPGDRSASATCAVPEGQRTGTAALFPL